MTVADEIHRLFRDAGATGFLHVRELGSTGREVAVRADEPVVLASTFKIPVAVAFERAVSAGIVDPAEPMPVTARHRRRGVGLAGLHDAGTISRRARAHLVRTMSETRATDVLYDRTAQAAL